MGRLLPDSKAANQYHVQSPACPTGRPQDRLRGAETASPVYGSAVTRFLYNVTNTVRDGLTANGVCDTTQLPSGDYLLRIVAAGLFRKTKLTTIAMFCDGEVGWCGCQKPARQRGQCSN